MTSEDSQEIRDVFPSVGTAPRTRNHQIVFLQKDSIGCLHTPHPLSSCSVRSRFMKQLCCTMQYRLPMPMPLPTCIRSYQAFHHDQQIMKHCMIRHESGSRLKLRTALERPHCFLIEQQSLGLSRVRPRSSGYQAFH